MDTPDPTPRREFLGKVTASALLLAGACAAPATSAAPATAPTPQPSPAPAAPDADVQPIATPASWDNSWFSRLTAKNKIVLEQSEPDYGSITSYGVRYLSGARDALGLADSDTQIVLVIRHAAVPMIFNDAMWAKYAIGEERKVKNPDGTWATKNPIATSRPQPARLAGRPQTDLPWFAAHGHIILGCNVAMSSYATLTARRVGGSNRAIYDEFKANLLPGVILQPNGVYATLRAQQAGCVYMRCP